MPALWNSFVTALIDMVIPPLCHVCQDFIPEAAELHVCLDCLAKLTLLPSPHCSVCGVPFHSVGSNHPCGACLKSPPAYDAVLCGYIYEGSVRELIHSFKYQKQVQLRRPLALLALNGILPQLAEQSPEVIVPVPLHSSRLKERGFNQAVLLGRVLSGKLSLPLLPDAMSRNRSTRPQVELSASERQQNVKGAFSLRRAEDIRGKRVLLLDDVITTGSTMAECARELKRGGAGGVVAVTVARTSR